MAKGSPTRSKGKRPVAARGSAKPHPRRSSPPREAPPDHAPEPEAPASPTPPEAAAQPLAPPTPSPGPQEAVAPPTASSAPLPTSEAPTGPEETTGAGPSPDEETESDPTEADTDEDDEGGGEPALAEARTPRPKGVAPELPLRVESVLFAAGKPVSVHDLTARLGGEVDHVSVKRALRKLQRAYANRNTSLEVRRAGEAWALQVRPDYLEVAHKVTPVDIPSRSLRVLALIAFHQPIRQSVLARMVGEAAYTEVKVLKELNFIHALPKASTLELTTSSHFAEYFGLETTDKDRIRERLAQRLGISLSAIPPPPPDPSDGNGAEGAPPSPEGAPKGPDPSLPLPAE
ncbi:MAG: SMC-Scp complex subunit ScpB [Euryarchaeota archaeon]|nr:SMC-Scp complex subunit ScpB [Euryarchaeota archaeon]